MFFSDFVSATYLVYLKIIRLGKIDVKYKRYFKILIFSAKTIMEFLWGIAKTNEKIEHNRFIYKCYADQKYANLSILSFTIKLNAETLSTTYRVEDKCISDYNIGGKVWIHIQSKWVHSGMEMSKYNLY